ncbi:MAG: hypothetical protein KGJ12_06385, partial [Gammaproteobacteria bacterium]|nr:hypothetical protein [Gammaproteobacteria bacterium]
TWFYNNHIPEADKVYAWLRAQMRAGIPVLMLGSFGFPMDNAHLQPLGLKVGATPHDLTRSRVTLQDKHYVGFEAQPLAIPDSFQPLRLLKGKTLLRITDRRGHDEDAIGLTPWGGYALSPNAVAEMPGGPADSDHTTASWVLNPFHFFRAALRLPAMPAPDTTTDSGRRMLLIHIDGDGFANKSWSYRYRDQYAAKVILDEILKKYRLPTSASFIVSYYTPDGLFPKQAAQLTAIARKIAALPWVEIGSHTYSHPFDWRTLEKDPDLSGRRGRSLKYGYNLSVPGYDRFSDKKEIIWAAHWINRHIAPPGKKTVMLQWSGNCDPDARAVGLTYRDGLMNINNGGASISNVYPTLTRVYGLGIWKGKYFQVYAPMQNEEVYTNGWRGPYYGYEQVIQTFKLTDKPRRIKPINIYYHFFSGERDSSLKALKKVYAWVSRQRTAPVYASTFSTIAVDFSHVAIARNGGAWIVRDYGRLQEMRIPTRMGYPDLAASRGVAGYDDHGGVRYIHLLPGAQARIVLRPQPPTRPYIHDANARIMTARRMDHVLEVTLTGHMPLNFRLGNARQCRLRSAGKPVPGKSENGLMAYHTDKTHGRFQLACG